MPAMKSAAFRVSPGGFEVSIATYSPNRRSASSACCALTRTQRLVEATKGTINMTERQRLTTPCPLQPFVPTSQPPLERAGCSILPDSVPLEAPSVHRDVDARRQQLHERQGAAQVEEAVR